MPEQILPLTGLDKAGVVLDIPPVSLPPQALTGALNVRFRNGAINKIEGDERVPIPSGIIGEKQYLAWWPNPNLAPNSGYYVVVTRDNNVDIIWLLNAANTDNFKELARTAGGGTW